MFLCVIYYTLALRLDTRQHILHHVTSVFFFILALCFPSAQANDTDVSIHENDKQHSKRSQNFSIYTVLYVCRTYSRSLSIRTVGYILLLGYHCHFLLLFGCSAVMWTGCVPSAVKALWVLFMLYCIICLCAQLALAGDDYLQLYQSAVEFLMLIGQRVLKKWQIAVV